MEQRRVSDDGVPVAGALVDAPGHLDRQLEPCHSCRLVRRNLCTLIVLGFLLRRSDKSLSALHPVSARKTRRRMRVFFVGSVQLQRTNLRCLLRLIARLQSCTRSVFARLQTRAPSSVHS